jgi:hypothetical protein
MDLHVPRWLWVVIVILVAIVVLRALGWLDLHFSIGV